MNSRLAASRFVEPRAISSKTSSSRCDSGAGAGLRTCPGSRVATVGESTACPPVPLPPPRGVPLAAAALAAAAVVAVSDLTGRAVAFVMTVVALAMAAWGLVLGLGPGFYFVLPALVFGIAALTSGDRAA